MGVKGLTRYLRESIKDLMPRVVLQKGDVLCVDGDAFVFHVLDKQSHEDGLVMKAELGGSYVVFRELAQQRIADLEAMGLELVWFFDGKAHRMKDATMDHRAKDIEMAYVDLSAHYADGAALPAAEDLPLPKLCKWQLKALLAQTGENVKECASEADQDIAKYVVSSNMMNNVGSQHYVYGQDSDFILMRDCPYIQFGSFGTDGIPSAQMWRRDEVAEALDLTEVQLLDLALLIGNDYTRVTSRRESWSCSVYGQPCSQLFVPKKLDFKCDAASIEALADLVRGNLISDDHRLCVRGAEATNKDSMYLDDGQDDAEDDAEGEGEAAPVANANFDVAALEEALEFSYATYELESLYRFESTCVSENDKSGDDANGTFMEFRGGSAVCDWFETDGRPQLPDVDTGNHMAVMATMYLHEYEGQNGLPNVSGLQVDALHRMVELLQRGIDPPLDSSREFDDDFFSEMRAEQVTWGNPTPTGARFAMTWDDFCVAYIFQRILSVLSAVDLRYDQHQPHLCFDGHVFKWCLYHEHRRIACADGGEQVQQKERVEQKKAPAKTLKEKKAEKKLRQHEKNMAKRAEQQQGPEEQQQGQKLEVEVEEKEVENEEATKVQKWDRLPIDDHREIILKAIARDRVTIIHGETGCGKSSCVPRFIMEEGDITGRPCRMMVSQPRRIAVSSLMTRLRTVLGKRVGMRMGHGIRDESSETQISFVTTGYLVRLLAHHPESMRSYTHLIIDEVHERSVDGDLVCMMALKLLKAFPNLRVILMSATIHTSLYAKYFGEANDGTFGAMECLSVGARRFPVQLNYAHDLVKLGQQNKSDNFSRDAALYKTLAQCGRDIERESGKGGAKEVNPSIVKHQYKAVVNLVRAVGKNGTGILVFVSGINDIYELNQLFEGYPRFWVLAIHSDIPYEEQQLAFQPAPSNMVKVVLATNAAESSITLPDVDIVIDMGTHKQLQYNAERHKTQLTNSWISKASATQRNGRTGRVRPGTVYRLYSQDKYNSFDDHEVAEVHRRPLGDVVLDMWVMMEEAPDFEGVTPVLNGLIEPPETGNISQSYGSLFTMGLISYPSDEGALTSVGRLTGSMPVDMNLGRMICYGIQLGVVAECIVIAAALSLPRTIFRYANPIHSTPEEYIEILRNVMATSAMADHGTYSEPIAMLRLLNIFRQIDSGYKAREWAKDGGMVWNCLSQFNTSAEHLARTVASAMRSTSGAKYDSNTASEVDLSLAYAGPLTDSKINLLRLILCWCGSGNILKMKPPSRAIDGSVATDVLVVGGKEVKDEHFDVVFGNDVPYTMSERGKSIYDGQLAQWKYPNVYSNRSLAPQDPLEFCENITTALSLLHEAAWEFYAKFLWVMAREHDGRNDDVQLFVAIANMKDGSEDGMLHKKLEQIVFVGKRDRFSHYEDFEEYESKVGVVEEHGVFLEGYTLCVATGMSKSEQKRLNNFMDYTPDASALGLMVIGPYDNAKLQAFNCQPPVPVLEKLFAPNKRGAPPYSVQSINNRRNIAFPPEHYAPKLAIPGFLPDEDAVVPDSLIEDLPYGHRLLNLVQQTTGSGQRKTRHLVVTKDLEAAAAAAEKEKEEGGTKPVPGSLEYALQQAGGADLRAAPESKIQIGVKCHMADWFSQPSINTYPADRERMDGMNLPPPAMCSAMLERQGFLTQSIHCGMESDVFSVCHNMMMIGRGNMCRVQGVTIFPPGLMWMCMAMMCNGANTRSVCTLIPGVTVDQLQYCRDVAAALNDESDCNVAFRKDIVDKINHIFRIDPDTQRAGEAAFVAIQTKKNSPNKGTKVSTKSPKVGQKKVLAIQKKEASVSSPVTTPDKVGVASAGSAIPTLEQIFENTRLPTPLGTKTKGKKPRMSATAKKAMQASKAAKAAKAAEEGKTAT